jgi:predicted RNA-binding Zn-ribbon protein involved in translation (DUF1610 family)
MEEIDEIGFPSISTNDLDFTKVVCGKCGENYLPTWVEDIDKKHTVFNYKCPKCGASDYNKTNFYDDENGVFQPLVSN